MILCLKERKENQTFRKTMIPATIPTRDEKFNRTATLIISKSTVRKSLMLFVIIERCGKISERNIPKTEPRMPPTITKRKKIPKCPRSICTLSKSSDEGTCQ